MEGFGANVLGPSSASRLSQELSSTTRSSSTSASPGDPNAQTHACSGDRHLQPSSAGSKGRGAMADLPPSLQEQKHAPLGSAVKQHSTLTHAFGRRGRGQGQTACSDCEKENPGENQRLQIVIAQLIRERLTTSSMCCQLPWA